MATLREHQSKALRNEKFLTHHKLSEGEFVDWAVTVLFYSALPWMRALAAQEGRQIRTYNKEDEVFQGAGIFTRQSYDWYRQLKDASRDARYEMTQFSASEFQDLHQNCFEPFKSFVTSNLRV